MADTTAPAGKAPWHLWVVGILSLLWNGMGAIDFIMTHTNNEAWLKGFSPEQRAYFHGFPLWSVIAWGVGTLGSFFGSVLLLLRKSFAFHLFAASLVGMALTTLYSFVLSDGYKVMGGNITMVIFNSAIFVIGVLLLIYTTKIRNRGVLR